MIDYQKHREGGGQIPGLQELYQAGLLGNEGISFGHFESMAHELRLPGDKSIYCCIGAGGGKSTSLFANNLIAGNMPHNFLCFDPREELIAISKLALSLQGFELFIVSPTSPQDRFNPLDQAHIDNPQVIEVVQKECRDICPIPKGGKTTWTYEDCQIWLNELCLLCITIWGTLDWEKLHYLISVMQSDLTTWAVCLRHAEHSPFPTVRDFAGSIMQVQKEGKESWNAPMGVLRSRTAFMRSANLRKTLSGDDFSLDDLLDPNRKIGVFLVWGAGEIETQSTAIRQITGSLIQRKLKAPGSAKVSVFLDEAGLLSGDSGFPSLRDCAIFGRGAGIVNNIFAFQSEGQLDAGFGQQADEIRDSLAVHIYKAVRTEKTAARVSRRAGNLTLEYNPLVNQSEAERMKRQIAIQVLNGGDIMQARADLEHYTYAAQHMEKKPRRVIEETEVYDLQGSEMIAFASGLVKGPIFGDFVNHFDRPEFAGLYLNNPWHSECVRIPTRFGYQEVPIVEEACPAALAHLPQYRRSGTWRFPKGYRPRVGR